MTGLSPGQVRLRVAVVGDGGKPVANAPVSVDIFSRKRFSYRQRLVGGFYAYDNTVVTQRAGQLCAGTTNDQGLLFCDAKPPTTGEAVVQASVRDDAGNRSVANSDVYIPGPDRLWFAPRDENRMDVLPENRNTSQEMSHAFAGADALRRGHRAGDRRTRGCDRRLGHPSLRSQSGNYSSDPCLRAQRFRLGVGDSRTYRSIQPTGLLIWGNPPSVSVSPRFVSDGAPTALRLRSRPIVRSIEFAIGRASKLW